MPTFDDLNPKMSDRIKFAVMYWSITVIACLYLVPAVIIASINPFWFRESALNLVTKQIKLAGNWRYKQVKPIVDKYTIFNTLKNS